MNMLQPFFDSDRDHYLGAKNAPIEIIEYGDFQCRNCAVAYPEVKLLQEIMGSRLKFIFRNFPLPNIHPMSLEAAIAAEAAAMQNKFWDMHDAIFNNHPFLTRSSLMSFADKIELDITMYEDNREHQKVFKKVIDDFESGVKSGVDKTPTFFINGLRYNGSNDFDSLYKTCNYLISIIDLKLPIM